MNGLMNSAIDSIASGGFFDLASKREKIGELEQEMAAPGFWDDGQAAQKVIANANELKEWVNGWENLDHRLNDILELAELAEMEADETVAAEIERDATVLEENLTALEFRHMMSEPADKKSAIVTIHPGAGGTESTDWAQMLMRMYTRWAERKGFQVEIMDIMENEAAGIKSVTLELTGAFAYGYVKAESGVHRLVRISPFDSQKRRHTSFASVFVYPELDDEIQLDVSEADIRVDTYRSSGAGGQHVNKTSSAVRMTHMPTGIVAQCQNERSQHKNRANCWKILMGRLYDHYKALEDKKNQAVEDTKKSIEWGSQIRSYVFQPYQMVKDHRTSIETSNVDAVMDGDIDLFINGFLTRKGDLTPDDSLEQ
jgi:peptide chain release factor 2